MKKLIINADEFGLTEGTNRAIIEAHQFGTVTSTSMIVNMWAFDEGVHLARENPKLGVGIHLNLTDGRPVSSFKDCSTLVDSKGFFFNRRNLMIKLTLCKINTEHIIREFKAQIEKMKSKGIALTHIDTHQSIGLHPEIFNIVIQLALELKLPIRIPEVNSVPYSSVKTRWLKNWIVHFACKQYRKRIKERKISSTDNFCLAVDFHRYWDAKDLFEIYRLVLSSIHSESSELMTHPSYYDCRLVDFMLGSEMMARQREEELKILLSPTLKGMIEQHGFELINFGDLR